MPGMAVADRIGPQKARGIGRGLVDGSDRRGSPECDSKPQCGRLSEKPAAAGAAYCSLDPIGRQTVERYGLLAAT
eukprot:759209-Hanusia_phi.AAC.6